MMQMDILICFDFYNVSPILWWGGSSKELLLDGFSYNLEEVG